MDPNEAMGFFPERHVLRARRLRAEDDVPSDPSDALTRRTATWMSVLIAIFTRHSLSPSSLAGSPSRVRCKSPCMHARA